MQLIRYVLITATLSLLAGRLPAGERPYEMVWANRTQDDHPALVPFTDVTGWRVEATDAAARFERSQEVLLFGDAVAKLTYRATGKSPCVTLYPPEPVAITKAFDAVTCWIYGNNHSYASDPKTPPVNIALTFEDSAGKPFSISLDTIHFKEWFLCHRRLDATLLPRVANGGKLLSISVTHGRNTEERAIYLNSLAVFTETLSPLTFIPRPQRGVHLFPDCTPGVNTGPGTLPFPDTPLTIIPRDSAPSVTRVAKSSRGRYLLIRDGEDGRLAVSLPSKAGDWDDLAMRWTDTGDWTPVCLNGGLFFAPEDGGSVPLRATNEEVVVTSDGKSVTYTGRLSTSTHTSNVKLRFQLIGKSLIIDLEAHGGHVQDARFGATRGFVNPRLVTLPYYTYGYADGLARPAVIVSGTTDAPLFFMAHIDWTQSNASTLWAENHASTARSPATAAHATSPRPTALATPASSVSSSRSRPNSRTCFPTFPIRPHRGSTSPAPASGAPTGQATAPATPPTGATCIAGA